MRRILFTLMIAGIFLTACVADRGTPESRLQNRDWRNGNFGNLTPEQRQQMLTERMQAATAACAEKGIDADCTITTPRGTQGGTCQMADEVLRCMFQRGPPNGRPTP